MCSYKLEVACAIDISYCGGTGKLKLSPKLSSCICIVRSINFSVPYTLKFSPWENFRQFRHLLSLAKFLSHEYFVLCSDYIEDMATFTILAKIYSIKYFCNTKISGLGEIFVKRKFSCIRYLPVWWACMTYWITHCCQGYVRHFMYMYAYIS